MTVTLKKDLYQHGTTQTQSLADKRRDRAARAIYVSGLTDARTALEEARAEVLADLTAEHVDGPSHPDDPTLQLVSLTPRPLSSGRAMVMAKYGRPPSGPPTQAAFDFAPESAYGRHRVKRFYLRPYMGGGETTEPPLDEWFKLDSCFGAGQTLANLSECQRLTGRRIGLLQSVIRVPYVLSATSLTTVEPFIDALNTDDVVINGMRRRPFTLQYMGVQEDPVDHATDGILRTGNHVFGWCAGEWPDYTDTRVVGCRVDENTFELVSEDCPSESWGDWRRISRNIPFHQKQMAFANQFPVHEHDGSAVGPAAFDGSTGDSDGYWSAL